MLAEVIIEGILLGSFYGLIGMGLSVVFGVMKLVNLSHGIFIMIGAYLGLAISTTLNISPILALVIIVPVVFVMGWLYQGVLVNRVVPRGMNQPLIVTFAAALIIRNILRLIFSADVQSLSLPFQRGGVDVLGLTISEVLLMDFAVAIIILVIMHLFFSRTFLGRAMRATSDKREMAIMVGVNTESVYRWSMAIACALAAVAGVMLGLTYSFSPVTGSRYLILGFGAVIIGGLGSIKGTYIGGLIIGVAQLLGSYYLGPGFQLFSGFIVVFVLLVIRPQGLFGREIQL